LQAAQALLASDVRVLLAGSVISLYGDTSARGPHTRHVLMTLGRLGHDHSQVTVRVRAPVNECMNIADRMARTD